MNRKEFGEWVTKILKWKPKYYYCWRIARMVLCLNEKNGKVGIARCHPGDEFNYSYGKAIAIARCAGKKVPTLSEYKMIRDLQNGDMFIYQGNKYRYIGRISERSHAVVVLANGRLENCYASNYEEVEICS